MRVVVGLLALVQVRALGALAAVRGALGPGRLQRVAARAALGEDLGSLLDLLVGAGHVDALLPAGSEGGRGDDGDDHGEPTHAAGSYSRRTSHRPPRSLGGSERPLPIELPGRPGGVSDRRHRGHRVRRRRPPLGRHRQRRHLALARPADDARLPRPRLAHPRDRPRVGPLRRQRARRRASRTSRAASPARATRPRSGRASPTPRAAAPPASTTPWSGSPASCAT